MNRAITLSMASIALLAGLANSARAVTDANGITLLGGSKSKRSTKTSSSRATRSGKRTQWLFSADRAKRALAAGFVITGQNRDRYGNVTYIRYRKVKGVTGYAGSHKLLEVGEEKGHRVSTKSPLRNLHHFQTGMSRVNRLIKVRQKNLVKYRQLYNKARTTQYRNHWAAKYRAEAQQLLNAARARQAWLRTYSSLRNLI